MRPAWLVVESMWVWYRRNWRSTVFSSIVVPLLFLLSIGYGLGSQVRSTAAFGGMSYVDYLAPALLVTAAVQNAAFESTYPILSGFKWQRVYWAMVTAPITPGQVFGGQLLWIGLRLFGSGAIFVAVTAILGAAAGPGIVLALLFAVLAGMAFAAPVIAYAGTKDGDGGFAAIFRFIVMPMTIFAGVFFPVSQLPGWIEPLVWLTPVWHGAELTRGVTFGTLSFWPAVGHMAFLAVMLAVGCVLAARVFRRRLET
ncbi:lipooligosaccharide transport system permease protein [Herbihabitans rhizosphaerae]|uniref:Transport permease protein n=2 Tax=Herbihabitans rhizosphaerae TaxID=1872711 RepID=A0A4Q7KDZ1_9PSEU|nr:lipooligosaccharide transport system permease protein [Herbihabitans rhizosphaerae]